MHMATLKVTGGKLLRVKLVMMDGELSDVILTGDFFVHPEDGVAWLEEAALGPLDRLQERLELAAKDLELVGFEVKDVVQVINNAIV